MNNILLNKNGFLHLTNVIDIEKIERMKEYIDNIDFNHMIYYDEYRLKENKWIKIESEMWWFKPIRCFLERGDKNHENDFVEKKNRRVLQIYKSNFKSLKNIIIRYKNDKTLGYKVKDKSCEYLSNYYIINHTFFNKLFKNTILDNYFKDYTLLEVKYFINKPDCIEQKIHIDEVEPSNICVTIPLNFNKDFGTTVMYNNEIVNKYKKNKNMKELINFDNIEKDIEEQKDFLRAEYKSSIKVGDILIFKGDTFHKGSKNLSEETRYFLHLRYQKKLKLNLNTLSLLYNY